MCIPAVVAATTVCFKATAKSYNFTTRRQEDRRKKTPQNSQRNETSKVELRGEGGWRGFPWA